MSSLENDVTIVTGAGSGIGRGIATAFASEGARVVCQDIDEESASETARRIEEDGGIATSCGGDVSSATDVATVVSTATDEYGGVDTLVNNAGIIDDSKPLKETPAELWQRVLDVNMTGVYLLTREALTDLLESDGGVVVNIASIAGKVAGGGGIAYTASKHGVIGFTKQLAHEYGPDVRANAICPGFIESGMTQGLFDHRPDRVEKLADSTPAQRPGTPEDVANVATFLASDDADFVHGAAVNVDGGWLVD